MTQPSPTDPWANADWVLSVTDPALSLAQINELFQSVIFATVPDDEADAAGSDDEGAANTKKILTAAQRHRQQEEDDELKDAKRELEGLDSQGEEDPDDEDILDFDKISENEEAYRDEDDDSDAGVEDREFQRWIDHEGDDDQQEVPVEDEQHQDETVPGEQALQSALDRAGLGQSDKEAALAPLPERLQEARRRKTERQMLPNGMKVTIDKNTEAVWILRQMCRPLHSLGQNEYLVDILKTKSLEYISDEAAVRAIEEALRLMFDDHLEPAHVMVYHQGALAALLAERWSSEKAVIDASAAEKDVEVRLSYGTCTGTGRRMRPRIHRGNPVYASFSIESEKVADDATNAWQGKGKKFVSRRPASIELGHLLVEIIELDLQCHRLEYARQAQLDSLRSCGTPDCIEAAELLESMLFFGAIECENWRKFSAYLVAGGASTGRYTQQLTRKKLLRFFSEFCITPEQYHANLALGRCEHISQNSTSLKSWQNAVAAATKLPIDVIMNIFKNALIEQFSVLPLLRKKVLDILTTDAIVGIKYIRSNRREYCRVSAILADNPRSFLDLLERQTNGELELSYRIDDGVLVRALNANNMFTTAEENSDWEILMLQLLCDLGTAVARREKEHLVGVIKYAAETSVKDQCVTALTKFCSLGPYEKSVLQLEQFSEQEDVRTTWEADWNVVESLPVPPIWGPSAPPRVCAAYKTPTNVTYFVCTDSCGVVVDSARWLDVPRSSTVYQKQQDRLLTMLQRMEPNVIAVAAAGEAAIGLMSQLQRFVFEVVHSSLKTHIRLVWCSTVIPHAFASSSNAEAEFSGKDLYYKACVSVARVTRDPLLELCHLFDEHNTILNLPLGIPFELKQDKVVSGSIVERLRWEMSLWIGACGVELVDILKLPNPISVLQFVPGLGPRKAGAFCRLLHGEDVGSRRDIEYQLRQLSPEVEENAAPVLRMQASPTVRDSYHVLDCTLIPSNWYSLAENIALALSSRNDDFSAPVALIAFLSKSTVDRMEAVLNSFTRDERLAEDLASQARRLRRHKSWASIEERDIEFIVDELVNLGRSTMRRTYRLMSAQQLFQSCTGVTYLPRGAPTSSSGLVIREGDYIEGFVTDVRPGGVEGIRLKTTQGVAGFIAAEDLPLQPLKDDLTNYLRELNELKSKRLNGENVDMSTALKVPDWLRRGVPIQGQVSGCMYDRCELRIRYTDVNDEIPDDECMMEADRREDAQPYDNRSETLSIRTAQLAEEAVFSNLLKVAHHVLFRNVDSFNDVERLLRDKRPGECIFWPYKGQRQRFILSILIGSRSIASWKVMEVRQANGQFAYSIKDERTRRTYDFTDPDHLIEGFVKRVANAVNNFRLHRRFCTSEEQARASLQNQVSQNMFGYVFLEHHTPGHPIYYCVLYRTAGHIKERRLDVHFSSDKIYVKTPNNNTSNRGSSTESRFWIENICAEHVSGYVKDLVFGPGKSKKGRDIPTTTKGHAIAQRVAEQRPVDLNRL